MSWIIRPPSPITSFEIIPLWAHNSPGLATANPKAQPENGCLVKMTTLNGDFTRAYTCKEIKEDPRLDNLLRELRKNNAKLWSQVEKTVSRSPDTKTLTLTFWQKPSSFSPKIPADLGWVLNRFQNALGLSQILQSVKAKMELFRTLSVAGPTRSGEVIKTVGETLEIRFEENEAIEQRISIVLATLNEILDSPISEDRLAVRSQDEGTISLPDSKMGGQE